MTRSGDNSPENVQAKLLQRLLDSVNDIVWCTSADGNRLHFLNRAAERVYGRPLEELRTDRNLWLQAVHPDDRHRVATNIRHILRNGHLDQVYRIVRPDGELRWLHDHIHVIHDDEGTPQHVGGITADITEQRQSESAEAESQAVFRSLVESLPLNVVRKDLNGRIVFCNQRYCNTMQQSLEQLLGKSDRDLFPPELADKYVDDDQRVIETGVDFRDVESHQTPEGETIHVEVLKGPVTDANGNVLGTQCLFWNVSDRVRAEQQMRRQTLEARLLFDATTVASQTNSFHKALQDCVNLVCRLTEWPVGHVYLPDEDDSKLVPTQIWHIDENRFSEFRRVTERTSCSLGEDLPGTIARQKAPHSIRNVQEDNTFIRAKLCNELGIRGALGFPILIDDELVAVLEFFACEELEPDDQLLLIFRTVGEQIGRVVKRRRIQEAIEQARDDAETANRAKSDFLANMSHEIRTPMNAVLGMSELLLDSPLDSSQREYAEMIRESGESLLEIINDILDFSKIEAGKFDLECQPFELQDSLGDTMKSLALRAHEKGLELAFHIAPDVPECLVGDRGRLRQVLMNLVGNAIKFTETGEVIVDVRETSRSSDDVVLQFSVRDTGVGIPADRVSHIFDAFEQADTSTTRRFGGTGLGLAISARLVELMQGRVWVESTVGRGSTFYFTARLQLTNQVASRNLRPQLDRVSGMSVLIVDDNASNRRILEETIRARGMNPVLAVGADEALSILHQAHQTGDDIPLILSDVNMPDMDGFAMVSEIRSDSSIADVVIIMLTSGARPTDRQRCAELGVAAHLMKPVKQSELFDAIVRACGITSIESGPSGDEPITSMDDLSPLRILLAEDVVANQMLAVGLLESKWGHQVTIAGNGAEAIEQLSRQPFDVVLMDVQMPEMDGFEATAAIRTMESEGGLEIQPRCPIPILAMTAHAMKGDRERCLEAGMDGYVSKPIRADDLQAALRSFCTPDSGDTAPDPAKTSDESVDCKSIPTTESRDEMLVNWPEALDSVQGDVDLLRRVVQALLSECPDHLEQLRIAIENGDEKTAHRLAHTIRGLFRLVAAKEAESLAAELEASAQDGVNEQHLQMQEQLAASIQPVLAVLEDFVAGKCGPE